MDESRRIADVDAVPDGSTLLVTLRDGDDAREVIVTGLADGTVAAWENHCQHWTDVRLDKGRGAVVRGNDILCQKHGATFERDTGVCTAGPCPGAVLDAVDVAVEEGVVYLAEDGWEVDRRGPPPDRDLSTRGGLDL